MPHPRTWWLALRRWMSEKICASSNSPIPLLQQCPRLPHSPDCQTPPEPPSAPWTSSLHTWSLRRIMPTVWDACSRASPKGQCNKRAERLRSTAQTTVAPVWLSACRSFSLLVFVRRTSDYVSLAQPIPVRGTDTDTDYMYVRQAESPDSTDCCSAPCLGPRIFNLLCRMTRPWMVSCDLSGAKAAAGVRRKQGGSGDLEGVIRVRRTGGSDVLASGCANERSISRGLLRVPDTMKRVYWSKVTAWSISISPMWTENCLLLVLPQCYLPNKEPHSQPISQRAANDRPIPSSRI